MNCKPGDLAVIVADPTCGGVDLGMVVSVICATYADGRGPAWMCESGGRPLLSINGASYKRLRIPDIYLRPIRPDSEPTSFESRRELEAA